MLQSLPQTINYLDLFSGSGGFALGLSKAGFKFKHHYCSEIDAYASGVYQQHFKNAQNLGDITQIKEGQIERPDIITFGSPCQDISIAGKRKGIKGKRSGLFFHALRLINIYKPSVFIFENVKGIFSSNSGKDFEEVLRAFADLGLYDIQWQLLNTSWFLPQNRERLYLVGHLRTQSRPEIFPIGEGTRLPQLLRKKRTGGRKDIASAITSNYSKGVHGRGETYVKVMHWKNSKEKWVQEEKTKMPTIKTQSDLTRQPLIISCNIPEATIKGYTTAYEGDSIDRGFLRSKERRGRVGRGKAKTIDTGMWQYTLHQGKVRRLTPLECERLQGFSDHWTQTGLMDGVAKEISDTQRYKMIGNAVSVPVVEAVAARLLQNKNALGNTDMKYPQQPEIVLGSTLGAIASFGTIGSLDAPKNIYANPEINIPELNVSYTRSTKPFFGSVLSTSDVAKFISSTFNDGEIELQESFVVLYLNHAQEIIGYYRHSKGMINNTAVDIRIVLAAALKCLAVNMVVAHNHPSGVKKPSDADLRITEKIIDAASQINVKVLDHIIITKDGFYSFNENGLVGPEPSIGNAKFFIEQVKVDLLFNKKHYKLSIEKLAKTYGITDLTEIKEYTELAIVKAAREIAHYKDQSTEEKFNAIVKLYENQVNLSHRTSQSILLQQYSTPAPIGYLMGIFCGIEKLQETGGYAYEPSAGNGLLTIAALPKRVYVNEIDHLRHQNLKTQGFANVWNRDATKSYVDIHHHFAAVITNPPFGKVDYTIDFNGYKIQSLEHIMAIRALDCMLSDGKAAIIIGGHSTYDAKGRIQAGKNRLFFNYLYSHYHVVDVIQINGSKLYSRQGTSFNTRLILIDGRKAKIEGAAPVYDLEHNTVVNTFEKLFSRVMDAKQYCHAMNDDPSPDYLEKLEDEAKALLKAMQGDGLGSIMKSIPNQNPTKIHPYNKKVNHLNMQNEDNYSMDIIPSYPSLEMEAEAHELGSPYVPVSNACVVLDTQVPDSMAFETQEALNLIKDAVGGDADNFVRNRLGYPNKAALCKALSAEQTDAVMMAIYNIEARGQGMIIGDQTGIGKGRVAAAIIRYACHQGLKPIFLTEKANLFSDIYRDLYAIGSGRLKPFIVNGRESKTDIKDEDGNIIFQALPYNEQQAIFQSQNIPFGYDFVVATYSQFNSPDKKPEKPNFLNAIAEGSVFILDEAHNSSGSSNTGAFLQSVIAQAKGVVFLSATFAKRPDNMPIYAMKTAISDCNMSRDDLVESIQRGGVALQEVLSSQLVAEGQMLRRERSFEGIEVNYLTLKDKAEEHRAIADNITGMLRDIIAFQKDYINPVVSELDTIAVGEGKEVSVREGTSQAGVDNMPYFSKVFNVINQMLFSIKAESVADRAIERLRDGKKPIIAFASTMGSFLEDMEDDKGLPVTDGSMINADFSEVMRRGLAGIMRYTEVNAMGVSEYKKFEVSELLPEAQTEYHRISDLIDAISTGITISPIDIVVKKIRDAGYNVAEVTGRKYELQYNWKSNKALVLSRRKINTNDAFRQFNNNEVDVLMINQSGSTGASAHAIPTLKVPKEQVKQRVMIVLQAELDINTEVQKRGRINRTGQILKPIYDYVTSAIPAENRLMMMLQKKLKSLDANTASNQKQSNKILDVPDFLNKYGDKVVMEYLLENPDVNFLLDDPLKLKNVTEGSEGDAESAENAAHKVSGRVAVLSVKMQQDFYNEISERYSDYVAYLQQIGEYDLELEAMNLETETINTKVVKVGKGAESVFGEDSIMETVKANVLKKPFSKTELENLLTESLKGADAMVLQQQLLDEYKEVTKSKLEQDISDAHKKHDELIDHIISEKKYQKLETESEKKEHYNKRIAEIAEAREQALQTLQSKSDNRSFYLQKIIKYYYIGRKLNYPIDNGGGYKEYVPTVFLGFVIDTKKKNPYAPSQIKMRFAMANSNKYIAIPASFDDIDKIMGASMDIPKQTSEQILNDWNTYVLQNNTDRRTRHIITGNLLQAFSDFKGKLVSYTTLDGKIEKGILMPEHWEVDEKIQEKVSIPVIKALPMIKALVNGSSIITSSGIAFLKQYNRYKIIVPMSRKMGGDIYLDKQLLALVEDNNFQRSADKMHAMLDFEDIDTFVEIIQNDHSCSVNIRRTDFNSIEVPENAAVSKKHLKRLEINPEPEPDNDLELIELEAEALALSLEMELELFEMAA